MIPRVNIKNYLVEKEQKIAHDLNQIIDAINDADGNDRFRIMMAIVKAKKLNDSDLVKKLEVQGEKAKENERKENEKDYEEQYPEYVKKMEKRKMLNRVAVGLDKVTKKLDVERKSKIASESPVKKNWDLYFITHIDNLQHVTKDGIVAPNLRPIDYKQIADKGIVFLRKKKISINYRSINEYAHAYFQPRNAMLAAVLKWDTPISRHHKKYIKHRLNEIVIIRINIDLTEHVLYMVDQNAASEEITTEDFVPSHRYMEIIPSIEEMLKETGWSGRPNEKELKKKMMAECHMLNRFPLNSLKAICIADEHSIKKRGYNFAEFYENVRSRISPESVLTANNIEQRSYEFFEGRYG